MSQMRLETGEFEVASEAALHRITQSTASLPPIGGPRNNKSGSCPSPFGTFGLNNNSSADARRPSTSGGKPSIPTKNRFPESAIVDDEEDFDSSGSDRDNLGNDVLSDTGMMEDDGDAASVAGDASGDGQMSTSFRNSAWVMRDPGTSLWSGQGNPHTPSAHLRPTVDNDVSVPGYHSE